MNFHHLAKKLLNQNQDLACKIAKKFPQKEVLEGMIELLRFLKLIDLSKEQLTPSQKVDHVWHELILFTKLYMDFCQNQYGQYIHHYPGGSKKQNQSQYEKTLRLYKKYFGIPNSKFWQDLDSNCGFCYSKNNLGDTHHVFYK